MNRFKRKDGRLWLCASLGTLLLLSAGTGLPQGSVEIVFELSETRVTANEPVYVRLSIDNGLREEVGFVAGEFSDSYFDLFVTEPGGRTLQADTMGHGGLRHVGEISVPAGGSYAQKLLVSRWYQFTKPGDYKLKFRPSGPVRTASGETIPFSPQELTLSVGPRDPARLGEICRSLAKAAAGYSNYAALREAADTLSFVQDPAAIPYLAQVLGYHNYVSEIAVNGLVRIGSPEALEVLRSNSTTAGPQLRMKIEGGIREIETRTQPQIVD